MSIAYRIEKYMKDKYSLLLSCSEATVITDKQGIILSCNGPFCRLLQMEQNQIISHMLTQYVIFPTSLLSQKDDGFVCKGKLSYQQKTIRAEIHMNIKVSEGRSYYVFSFYPECANKTMINQVLSALPMGILLVDSQHIIYNINQAACTLLGVNRSDVIYGSLDQALRHVSEHNDHETLMQNAFQISDQFQQHDIQWCTCEEKRDLLVTINPLISENDGFTGTFYFLEDMTEKRSLEKQVWDNNRLATIGQIAAGSAHEIRNPLTSIKGFLQMFHTQLEESGQTKEQKYIQLMLKEINRINLLVGEFLMLSKPRQINCQYVSLVQVVDEIFPILKSEAILHRIDFNVEKIQKHFPLVCVDSKLVKQVLLNLCKNAIEAMDGKGSLTMQMEHDQQEKQMVVHIVDTGPGIPENLLQQVFEPFFTTKEKGTGLGLPICKQIMKDLGGQLAISSSEKGTTFSVYIPVT